MIPFTHLHVHTQYSILDGAADIKNLIQKAKANQMTALAITDHGVMYGVKEFFDIANQNNIKPIIGCETYVARKSHLSKTTKEDRSGDHLILLAKNKIGYSNLIKLISIASIDGFYYKPRIDKELLKKYNEGLIASSACLGGEIPRLILEDNLQEAEKSLLEYVAIFNDDFYIELQRLGIPEQELVNTKLIELSKKYNIKLIATNDVHFVNKEDFEAHDVLICLNTNKELDDETRMKYTGQEYFKTQQEINLLFQDIPQAIENTNEIVNKIEEYSLNQKVMLPVFPLPSDFTNEDDYLQHLTYKGAEKRYNPFTDEIKKRIDFELSVIKNMGFAGYFLIVQDFISAAKKLGVSVGPGRGSAAGSVVAYCIGIINIDPLKYGLLFERFLNPERVTMPDIDIDFDEDGRDLVLKYVVEKYGREKVAQVITYGTMAAKLAIRDVARVLELPLSEADKLAKYVPKTPKITLKDAYTNSKELEQAKNSGSDKVKKTLQLAESLEGNIRHTGIHACGVIIGQDNLINHIPLCTSKDTDLLVSQFDGRFLEDVGMLKMDFLGLKTLSIIRDTIQIIKESKGITIDIEKIPFDDPLTFELFQRGDTVAVFQFESEGMRTRLSELKPTRFEDLIAMTSLYRPGPMDHIPTYIKRRHGLEKVDYPHPIVEEILKETYGIMVYQEQIMQIAQVMAGYSLGKADLLRRAMGKKKPEIMAQQKAEFIKGSMANGISEKIANSVFDDMEKFAGYGFNKSHAAAYSIISFQTAYLKAHYPAEFMAAVLSRHLDSIEKITFFLDECKHNNLRVLCPDVNESVMNFTVNKNGDIRFGLRAIKGVGEGPVKAIIDERRMNGLYKSIFDFVERVNLQTINKRCFEALAYGGAFDSFAEIKRHQFFYEDPKEKISFIEQLIRYGNRFQSDNSSSQKSLFGGNDAITITKPPIPSCEEWSNLYKLSKERELIGIYLSAHPLDEYKIEINTFCSHQLSKLNDIESIEENDEVVVAGIVTNVKKGITKTNKPYASITIEDYSDNFKFHLFANDLANFVNYFSVGYLLLIKGRFQKKQFAKNEAIKELEFKIQNVFFLSEVREKLVKKLNITLPLSLVSESIIEDIKRLIENNKGQTILKICVFDSNENIKVSMFSRKYKINVTNELLHYLESNRNIIFSLEG